MRSMATLRTPTPGMLGQYRSNRVCMHQTLYFADNRLALLVQGPAGSGAGMTTVAACDTSPVQHKLAGTFNSAKKRQRLPSWRISDLDLSREDRPFPRRRSLSLQSSLRES